MSKPPLILHIGNHKTGTSAIQKYCGINRDALAKAKTCWPSEQLPDTLHQHSKLARWVRSGELEQVKAFLDRADQEALTMGAHKLLLSGEDFSNLVEDDVKSLKEVINNRNIRIIIYFRNIYETMISIASEFMKRGSMLGPPRKKLTAISNKLDYASVLTTWERAFGKKNVEAYCYNDVKQNLVNHFLDVIGISPDIKMPSTSISVNRSLPFPLATLLHFSGEISSMEEYKVTLKRLQPGTLPKTVWTPELSRFAQTLVLLAGFDIKHPKLRDFQAQLGKLPDIDCETKSAADILKVCEGLFDDKSEI